MPYDEICGLIAITYRNTYVCMYVIRSPYSLTISLQRILKFIITRKL